MSSSYLAVVTTTETREAATALARAMVERRLAACAQVSAIDSVYRWEGRVVEGQEFRLVLKTPAALYDALEAAILEAHDYDVPAVQAYPATRTYDAYAEWIDDCTA